MARRKGSARWLKEHFRDPYVRGAQRAGYRSRAAYKLAEIDRGERLLTSGLIVVDLGAAPGGWSQYAAERVGAGGRVFALDLRPMDPLEGVTFIQGDFREDEPLERIRALLGGRGVGLVISDMAP
ncbi:MAG: RlmE family RNA methyltransferase, partial [Gammaproteobacteria bacterium]|nr:RlmE family RNA methyltransferase [Gammaproteobacteria bacterium]